MNYWKKLLIFCSLFIFLIGCAANENQGSQPNYEETKKMIVDILKTDDGKKAIQEILTDEKIKQEILMEQDFVKETIQTTLTSEEGKKFWEEQMKDPKFVESLAKSMQKENEKVLKGLMNDPEYQKKMKEILKDPEMEKQFLDLMKSTQYREQTQEMMTEALQNPLFKAEIAGLLEKLAEEQQKAAESSKKEEGGEEEKSQEEGSEEEGGGEAGGE
ncbi:spore germination lipoprotein GerD [Bacillus taeanensis]|uniref:Spore gernimation protein GerD n=1 Tax=Bacillus taeanensis TaxID=273032 RepID=A0A366XUI5_9BACI|nr:spore germination lipoprotein GerD [Bacillus taeanensis]RBW67794.1 spore gernimation protein GerD [Bacillus taeanensis]